MTFCEMPSIILTSDRVADACGACNLGRACGVSSFFLMRKRGESCRAKVFFRNICAHGERLYSYKTKNAIPDFPIHDKLGIIKKGKQYECGKHDLFAVVISLRYLLPKDLFKKFKQELANLLSKHLSATSCYTEKEFLKYMGFPENWIKITRYRKL